MSSQIPETELASLVVDYLKSQGYEIFHEVKHPDINGIADIVATKDDEILVCEVKRTAGIEVYAQARKWIGHATKVVVAALLPSNHHNREAFLYICKDAGIGVLEIAGDSIIPCHWALHNGRAMLSWNLTEAHKNSAPAGTQTSGRVSKKSDLQSRVLEYVSSNNGCALEDIHKDVTHPFGRCQQGQARLLKAMRHGGSIKGLQVKKGGGIWWVRLENASLATGRVEA